MESDQTIEENGRKSDVLYAAASVTPNAPETDNDIYYDTDTRKLNVRMGHILSKLTVNIRYGTEMTHNDATPSLTSVTLGETQTGYTMDLTSGSVGATGGKSEISMMLSDAAVEGYSKSAEAILVPQSAAFTITVIVDERTFVYNNAAFEFKKATPIRLTCLWAKTSRTSKIFPLPSGQPMTSSLSVLDPLRFFASGSWRILFRCQRPPEASRCRRMSQRVAALPAMDAIGEA